MASYIKGPGHDLNPDPATPSPCVLTLSHSMGWQDRKQRNSQLRGTQPAQSLEKNDHSLYRSSKKWERVVRLALLYFTLTFNDRKCPNSSK